MSETFTRIAAGHYRNSETGVEIVKVSADEAGPGMGGWHVTVPVRGASFVTDSVSATTYAAGILAETAVRAMRRSIELDFEEATAVIHHVTRYSREISCGAGGPVRVEEVARLVTCPECVAADDARRMAEAERQAHAEAAERSPLCTAKVNPMYPHTFKHDADVAADPEIVPGYDTCGRNEAGHADYTTERILDANWFQAVYNRAVDNTRGHLEDGAIVQARRELLAEAHAEALAEDGGGAAARAEQLYTWGLAHSFMLYNDAIAKDHAEALLEDGERYAAGCIAGQVKADAAQIIAASRETDADRIARWGEVPADLDDDEAWATYCAALPEPTDREIADVLAEYGDPYAASRAEVVETYKNSARSIWKIRAGGHDDELTRGLIRCLRSSMRTLRGVIEIYDACSESWRMEVRTGSARDSFTKTFDGPATVSMPGMAARTVVAGDTLRISVQPPTFS